MTEKTKNIGLTKPDETEFYDVNVTNENWDITDKEIGNIKNPEIKEASARENIENGDNYFTILGKIKRFFSDLKNVAFTGKYQDLEGKPEIPAAIAVKGNAETNYRTGNVNLTPDNIGALARTAVVSNNTTTVAGYALDARHANPNVEGSLAKQIGTLNRGLANYLPLSGGIMTGNLEMGGHTLGGVGDLWLSDRGFLKEILDGKIPTSASCNKNWEWTGKEGQPTWLWGGNDIKNMYVYNPSNFRVAYARDTAGVIAGAADVRVGMSADGMNFRTYNKDGTAAVNGYTNLGSGSYRWKQLFATTATISTSDRNLKKDIHQLTDTHLDFFLKLQPVSFLFKDGESGRTHIGFIAQDVEQAMSECGLTDLDFAGFCKDQKVEVFFEEDENGDKIEKERPILDENGNPEYIYSLRYEEFIALNTYAIQKLWNCVEILKKENVEMQDQIKSIQQDIAELKKSRA